MTGTDPPSSHHKKAELTTRDQLAAMQRDKRKHSAPFNLIYFNAFFLSSGRNSLGGRKKTQIGYNYIYHIHNIVLEP